MHKLSQRHQLFQKVSKRSVEQFVKDMKEKVKKDPEMIAKFKEYNIPISDIDTVSVTFCPLDVSAKTKNKKIYLNLCKIILS